MGTDFDGDGDSHEAHVCVSLSALWRALRSKKRNKRDEEPRCHPCQTCGPGRSVLRSGERGDQTPDDWLQGSSPEQAPPPVLALCVVLGGPGHPKWPARPLRGALATYFFFLSSSTPQQRLHHPVAWRWPIAAPPWCGSVLSHSAHSAHSARRDDDCGWVRSILGAASRSVLPAPSP